MFSAAQWAKLLWLSSAWVCVWELSFLLPELRNTPERILSQFSLSTISQRVGQGCPNGNLGHFLSSIETELIKLFFKPSRTFQSCSGTCIKSQDLKGLWIQDQGGLHCKFEIKIRHIVQKSKRHLQTSIFSILFELFCIGNLLSLGLASFFSV